MQSLIERELRNRLVQYSAGEMSLAELQDWLVPNTWHLDRTEDQSSGQLVYRIELLLAEYSNGHWTESELRAKLRDYVRNPVIVVDFAPTAWIQTITTSAAGYQPEDSTHYFGRGTLMPSAQFSGV